MKVRIAEAREWEDILDLRYRVLREPWNQGKESATDEMESQSLNAVLFDAEHKLLACGRLHQVDENTGQIRYMAVREGEQGRGYGKSICLFLENEARRQGLKKIILQARENALEFYLRNGYSIKEKSFLLWGKIQHYLMAKEV